MHCSRLHTSVEVGRYVGLCLLVPLSTSGRVSSPLQPCFLSQYFGYKANCLLLSSEQQRTCWWQILPKSTRDSLASEHNLVILMLKRFCFSVPLVAQQKSCSPYSNRHWTEFIPNSILQSNTHKLPFLLPNKNKLTLPKVCHSHQSKVFVPWMFSFCTE